MLSGERRPHFLEPNNFSRITSSWTPPVNTTLLKIPAHQCYRSARHLPLNVIRGERRANDEVQNMICLKNAICAATISSTLQFAQYLCSSLLFFFSFNSERNISRCWHTKYAARYSMAMNCPFWAKPFYAPYHSLDSHRG